MTYMYDWKLRVKDDSKARVVLSELPIHRTVTQVVLDWLREVHFLGEAPNRFCIASSEPASRLLLSTATPCIPAFPRSARPARDAHQAWLSLPTRLAIGKRAVVATGACGNCQSRELGAPHR